MSPTEGLYLYAVVAADAVPADGPTTTGTVGGGALEVVRSGRLAAIVSPFDGDWVPATRRHLNAHADVVEHLMRAGTVLPVRFGVVAPGRTAVGQFLDDHRHEFLRALHELDGTVEVRVTARYEQDVAIREAAARDATVRRLSERTRARPGAATYYDRIRLGEAVAGATERIRQQDGTAVLRALAPHAIRSCELPATGTETALQAAFLVDPARRAALDRTVERLAAEQAGRLRFQVVGPLPPWDFVDVDSPTPDRRARTRSR